MKQTSPFFLLFVFSLLQAQVVQTPNPIMFVTQTPVSGFSAVTQTFNNHNTDVPSVPRGGDLMIRYPDGTLRNLTREAGFGDSTIAQSSKAIAVRQPSVHWNGAKALFSMLVGAPAKEFDYTIYYWQIYEVTGLGKSEKAVITKVANQPANYNNISPIYGSDGKIIFTSDMPFNKAAHLYPQLDEYETAKIVSGLWSLDPASGNVTLLEHSPSGSFYPIVDSYGRILFTRWDHLQRDQQADADRYAPEYPYGMFNYSSEAADAVAMNTTDEVFPEPRDTSSHDYTPEFELHRFNHFFPWQLNQDGTEEETLNHVGRHEYGGSYTEGSYVNDPNLSYLIRKNFVKNKVVIIGDGGLFHIKEDPLNPGVYYGVNAHEFSRETAGQILKFTGAPDIKPEEMDVIEITHEATVNSNESGNTPAPNHSGHYRNPLPLSDGTLIVSHTSSPFVNQTTWNGSTPKVLYDFRLKTMKSVIIDGKNYFVSDAPLTNGIVRSLKYYTGESDIITRTDTLWELDAVEVRSQTVPPLKTETPLELPEQQVFTEEKVDVQKLRDWLKANNLALMVSRNVTTRDRNDVQQPYNLKVPGGVQTIGTSGTVYDIQHMQFFQGDMIRGKGGVEHPGAGRRVLAQVMHDPAVKNPANPTGPGGSVKIGLDGSVASFIPAHRAMSWQMTDPNGKGVVRERYWITFQPGEIRTCASCHGINAKDQAGAGVPQNKPEALRELLKYWKTSLTSVEDKGQTVATFELQQNYPNPFNPSTTINFAIPASGLTTLKVYDAIGREVATLVNEVKDAGYHSAVFNGEKLSSGIYFAKLQNNGKQVLKKMMLLK